jgi:regulator of ribonuclease activity A
LASIPQKSQRKGIGEVDISLYFGGVHFNSGDYVYADNNGIIVAKEKLIDL